VRGPASTRRVALNIASNWGGQLFGLALSFAAAPFIVHRLGDSAYGVWMLMVAIAGYLGLMDLGVRGAVTRYVARFAASGDHESASRTASAAMHIFIWTGVLAVLLAIALAFGAVDRLDLPEQYRAAAQAVLVLIGLNVGISLVSGTFAGAIAALQRFDLLNLIEAVIGAARTIATVLALAAGYGIVTMAAIQTVLAILRGVWLRSASRRLYPELHFGAADRQNVRLIFSFSVLSFLIHISGRVIYYTDSLVIAAFLPVSMLTFFAIGAGLVDYARALISSISYTTSPLASSLDGLGEQERIRTLLGTSVRFSMLILLPVAVTFIVRGSSFIGLWMGASYAGPAGRVLAILAVPLLFHAGAHGAGGILLGLGKHKPLVPALLVEATLNLGLSVALVRTIGIEGVAWGTAIPAVAASVLFWPWYISSAVGFRPLPYLTSAWLKPWAATVPFLLATVAVERLWPATSLALFFAQVLCCLPLAAVAYWLVCLTSSDRDTAARLVRGRLQRALPTSVS